MSSAAARAYATVQGLGGADARSSTVTSAGRAPVVTSSVAYQAARAQAILDRIADVSELPDASADEEGTMTMILKRLDAREALLSDLEPVVAELSLVRDELSGQGESAAHARALQLALAPVEQAARRALDFHGQLLEKMQAMRDEMVWELARLDQLDAMAHGYMFAEPTPDGRVDIRR